MLPKYVLKIISSFREFPHIIRNIAAPIFLITLVILNLMSSTFIKMDRGQKLRSNIIKNPFNSKAHEQLAQYYLELNTTEAGKEYALAEEYYSPSPQNKNNTLGDVSSPWTTWQNILTSQEKLSAEIEYWDSLKETLPDYNYAFLKLATLYFQSGQLDLSRKYLNHLLENDPTNSLAIGLKGEL